MIVIPSKGSSYLHDYDLSSFSECSNISDSSLYYRALIFLLIWCKSPGVSWLFMPWSEGTIWQVVLEWMTKRRVEELRVLGGRYDVTLLREEQERKSIFGTSKNSFLLLYIYQEFPCLKTNAVRLFKGCNLKKPWKIACNKIINVKKMMDAWGALNPNGTTFHLSEMIHSQDYQTVTGGYF